MTFKKQLLIILLALTLGAPHLFAAPPENSAEIMEHLEFMGYEATMNSKRIKGKHSKHLNIYLRKYRGGILATAQFGGNDYARDNKGDFIELLNELNQKAAAGRYYVDGDGDLIIEGYYPGTYNKQAFSAFLDAFNLEKNHIAEMRDRILKFIK